MVSRSVPYYDEMQRMTVELVRDFAVDDSNIYDIGCATGTTMALIDRSIGETKANLVGIDNSPEMLDQAREKITLLEIGRAHDCTPVTNANIVCRLLLEHKKKKTTI